MLNCHFHAEHSDMHGVAAYRYVASFLELFVCVLNLSLILKESPDSCCTSCSVPEEEEEENGKEEAVIRMLV